MMKKTLCLLLLALIGFMQLNAQENAGFPLKKIPNLPSNFYLTELGNGLEILVIEDHSVPLATIELVVKNGAFVQTPELEGLAHLYEHMFFKANKDYPDQEAFLDRVNELGIVFNGTTSEERVNYYVTLSKSKVDEGLQFMNSATRYPKFLKEEMEKENVVVAGEFQRNESSPFFHLFQKMDQKLWGKEVSRKNTIGRYEVILNATPAIMTDIKNRYYYPNNSMLVIAGDVSSQEIFRKVNDIYGDWKRSDFNIFEKYPIPEFEPITKSESFVVENANARVPLVLMSWHGPNTRNSLEATYAADVFSFILSQKNSKLQKALVESGLALQVSVSYSTMRHTGPINVILVPNPGKVKEAMEALEVEMAQWDDPDYYTDEQMITSKEMLEIDDLYGKEKTSNYIHTVTYWWASASLEYYANYINNLKMVTKADIQKYVQTYIKNKPHYTGVLVSPQMRKMIKLDEFFPLKPSVSRYMITASGQDVVEFDQGAENTIKTVAAIVNANPDMKLTVHVRAPKSMAANMRARELKEKLMMNGVAEDRIKWDLIVKKDKKLKEEEKPLQNTITFSL